MVSFTCIWDPSVIVLDLMFYVLCHHCSFYIHFASIITSKFLLGWVGESGPFSSSHDLTPPPTRPTRIPRALLGGDVYIQVITC